MAFRNQKTCRFGSNWEADETWPQIIRERIIKAFLSEEKEDRSEEGSYFAKVSSPFKKYLFHIRRGIGYFIPGGGMPTIFFYCPKLEKEGDD